MWQKECGICRYAAESNPNINPIPHPYSVTYPLHSAIRILPEPRYQRGLIETLVLLQDRSQTNKIWSLSRKL